MHPQSEEGRTGTCAYLGAPGDLGMHMVEIRSTALVSTGPLGGVSKDIPHVQPIVNSSMDEAQTESAGPLVPNLSPSNMTHA